MHSKIICTALTEVTKRTDVSRNSHNVLTIVLYVHSPIGEGTQFLKKLNRSHIHYIEHEVCNKGWNINSESKDEQTILDFMSSILDTTSFIGWLSL